MRIRRLAPALLVPIALAATATAAPIPKSAAYTTFTVTSGATSYDVRVLAVEGRALVTVEDDGDRKYAGPAAVTIGTTGVTLRTRLGATPLTVTWSDVNGAVVGGGGDSTSGTDISYAFAGRGATARVVLGDTACTIEVFSMVGTVVGDELPSSAAPLAKASVSGSRCGEVAYSTVP